MHRKGDLGQPGISQEKFSGGDKERGGIYQKKKRGRIEGWHCRYKDLYWQRPVCAGLGGNPPKLLEWVRGGRRRCYRGAEGPDYEGPLSGTASALYPLGSEVPLKAFTQEFHMDRSGV